MKNKLFAGAVLFALTAALGRAYVISDPVAVWSPGPIPLDIMLSDTPRSDFTTYNSTALAAVGAWNYKLATVQFVPQTFPAAAAVAGNGRNELAFSATVGGQAYGSGVLAVTLKATSPSVHQMLESDVLFNPAVNWSVYRGALQSSEDIQRVILHELGHVLGLDHPDEHGQSSSIPALMNSHVSDLDLLAADDLAGAQSLYGAPGQVHAPANDHFSTAAALANTANQTTVTGSTVYATAEPDEPAHTDKPGLRSAWWRWTAPGTGDVTITTAGSRFDTTLAIYTGTALSNLKPIVSNDDVDRGVIRYSSVSFPAFTGQTYWIAVDGWNGDSGPVTLNLNFPLPLVATPPVDQSVAAGANVTFSAVFAAPGGYASQWQQLSPAGDWLDLRSGTTVYTTYANSLTFTTTRAMDGAQFRCVATNAHGFAISPPATLHVAAPAPPVIQSQPTGVNVILGSPIAFTIQVSEGNVTWFHNGAAVGGDSSTFAGEPMRLTVRGAARAEDAGAYYGVVTNLGGSVATQTVQVTVLPLAPIAKVMRSFYSTMMLRTDGTRWVCGSDLWQFYAGNSATPRLLTPDSARGAGAASVNDAALGALHDLYVTADGRLWSHGTNDDGQLGDGTTTTRYTPVFITANVSRVFAGQYVSYFIKTDGSLWGMGRNGTGQMGDGTTTNRLSPMKIADRVRTVSTYYQTTFFIKNDDTLWALGSNFNGGLGLGDIATQVLPALVASEVSDVFAGQFRCFFRKKDGSLWGMGDNQNGALGDGTTNMQKTPVLIATDLIAASAGSSHSLFLKSDHTLWGVGDLRQQFGQPATNAGLHPTPVLLASDIAGMTAGTLGSFVIDTDGALLATGWNDSGALGLGAVSHQAAPAIVLRPQSIPVLTWPAPAPIAYGTALSGTQLNAAASTAGTFTYTPGASTLLPVGTHTLHAVFAPANPDLYAPSAADATLTVTEPLHPGALVNISTRAHCATGDAVTIGGFVVTGDTPKRFLVRAVGPTLGTIGIDPADVLTDPAVEVYRGSDVIAVNDNWGESPSAAQIPDVAQAIGAIPLAGGDTSSAALLLTLDPGVYTFVAHGHDANAGVVLLEVYDADTAIASSRFSNISTRAQCVSGNGVAIGGFVIAGDSPRTVLLRAVGSTLATFGLAPDSLVFDPTIELHDAVNGNAIIATNDNWRDNNQDAIIAAANARTGATPFAADDLRSAALVVQLPPGVYSFVARSKTSASGILLVEIYSAD